MTREEKQKAIDALKISVPIMAVTQEEFNDYIRTLNKVMDWLEQEPFINKPCISAGVCEHDKQKVLEKIRAEIDKARFVDKDTRICKNALASGLDVALQIIDKYRTESEPQESEEDNGNDD